MKNPVLAASVFLLAALSLVAALTLSARTDSTPSDNVAGADNAQVTANSETAGNTQGKEKSTTPAKLATRPPVVSEDPRFKGMVWIPAGKFTMGEIDTVPDEFPPHEVELDGFWMDATEVANAAFKDFTDATGYITTAERAPELRSI